MSELRLFDVHETVATRARRKPKPPPSPSEVLAKGRIFSVAFGSNLYLYRADRPTEAHVKFLAEHFDWQHGGKAGPKRIMPPTEDEVVVHECTPADIERLIALDLPAVKRVMR